MDKRLKEMIKIKLYINSDSKDCLNIELPKTQKLDKLKSLVCLMYNFDMKSTIITHDDISIEDDKLRNLNLDNISSKTKSVSLILHDKTQYKKCKFQLIIVQLMIKRKTSLN